jgi:hypothetical protein
MQRPSSSTVQAPGDGVMPAIPLRPLRPLRAGPAAGAARLALALAAASWCAAEPAPDDMLALNADADLSSLVPRHTSLTISGAQLGGLIGLDLTATVEFLDDTHFHPFIDTSAGLSGMRYGLGGIYLSDPKKHWFRFSPPARPEDTVVNYGIGARAVIVDRWRDGAHREEALYGVSRDKQTYLGAEGMVVVAGVSLTPGVYRDDRTHEKRWALAYGLGF